MVDTRRRVRISKTSTRRKKRVGGAKDKKTNVKKTAVTAVKNTGGRVDRKTAWKDIEEEMKKGKYTDIDVIEKGWFFNRKVRVGLPSETLQKAIQSAMDNNIYSDRTRIVHSSDSRAARKTCDGDEGYSVKKSYKKDGWEGSALNLFGNKYIHSPAVCVKRTDNEMIKRIDVLSRKGNKREQPKDKANDKPKKEPKEDKIVTIFFNLNDTKYKNNVDAFSKDFEKKDADAYKIWSTTEKNKLTDEQRDRILGAAKKLDNKIAFKSKPKKKQNKSGSKEGRSR